jgi:hypothetical protein
LPFQDAFFNLQGTAVSLSGDTQGGGQNLYFLEAAHIANGHTSLAADQHNIVAILDHLLKLFQGFSISNYHDSHLINLKFSC